MLKKTFLECAWEGLQADLGAEPGGVLIHPAAGAGKESERLQRDVTWLRETGRFKQLDVEIRSLAITDMRLQAWANLDSFSTAWVTCWPQRDCYLTNDEFLEVSARYLGLPSPACEVQAGSPITGTHQTLDRFGCNLSSLPLPGDGWREQHDSIKWRIAQDAKGAGVPVRPEVYGLFAACIPQHGRRIFDALPVRKQQGLVPDLELSFQWDGIGPERQLLFEFKTLHYGSSTYRVPDGRCQAVARRANALPGEYIRKARAVDAKYCGILQGEDGPVQLRLRRYDPVKGLVFGHFGEASPDVHKLVSALARAAALRSAGADDTRHGLLSWFYKRRWSITAVRAAARLTLARLASAVGHGTTSAAHRRAAAEGAVAQARRAACEPFWGRSPRVGPRCF